MILPRPVRIRVAVVLGLWLVPALFFAGAGAYHLWDAGWSFIVYVPAAFCWLTAYYLARRWTRKAADAPPTEPPPGYWTDRDKLAWDAVADHLRGRPAKVEDFGNMEAGAREAEALALVVARVYHPGATDPFGHLTLPELLACGELVSEDLGGLVTRYFPGSHLVRVNDLRRLGAAADAATDWYPRLRNAYWAVAAVFNPAQTAAQVFTTKAGMAPVFKQVQQNLLVWFQTAQGRQLGKYLIELNSGRLKVGAKRYRELLALHLPPEPSNVEKSESRNVENQEPAADGLYDVGRRDVTTDAPPVTVALVGPVKAGKSSLVNAILGEERAATDVLPLTPGATRYTLQKPGQPTLSVMDTAGFGNDGPSEADVLAAADAAGEADVLLLVVPARSAARQPESAFLDRVRAAVAAKPHLRMPPALCVLSHVDLLTPAREWAPPYDWRTGERVKERSIREAVAAAAEVFGDRTAEVLPVCTAAGKELGREELLARVSGFLGDARGVGLLRALHAEAAADRYKRVVGQVASVGGALVKAFLDSRKK